MASGNDNQSFPHSSDNDPAAITSINSDNNINENSHHTAAADVVQWQEARVQEQLLPNNNVTRIMRRAVPSNVRISNDAKKTVQQCASEFMGLITSEANKRCQWDHRKIITADDIVWAMRELGFDDYIEPLTLFLHRYREAEGVYHRSIRGDLHILPPPVTSSSPPPSMQHNNMRGLPAARSRLVMEQVSVPLQARPVFTNTSPIMATIPYHQFMPLQSGMRGSGGAESSMRGAREETSHCPTTTYNIPPLSPSNDE